MSKRNHQPRKRQFSDEEISQAIDEISETARTKIYPQLSRSRFAIMIDNGTPDPYFALQLGAALLMDKPILIMALPGSFIPPRLRRIADAVIEADSGFDLSAKERLREAITALLKRQGALEGQ